MPKGNQMRGAESGRFVTIDRNFIREEAREAVRQFFRPITAPFEPSRAAMPDKIEAKRGVSRPGERR